jgi:hypothetical protein
MMPPFVTTGQNTEMAREKSRGDTDPFEEFHDWLARKSAALFKPVLDSFHAPTHRLVLLAEAQTGVVYPEKLYGLRIPAFSEVCGDEVKDTVVSVTVQ